MLSTLNWPCTFTKTNSVCLSLTLILVSDQEPIHCPQKTRNEPLLEPIHCPQKTRNEPLLGGSLLPAPFTFSPLDPCSFYSFPGCSFLLFSLLLFGLRGHAPCSGITPNGGSGMAWCIRCVNARVFSLIIIQHMAAKEWWALYIRNWQYTFTKTNSVSH